MLEQMLISDVSAAAEAYLTARAGGKTGTEFWRQRTDGRPGIPDLIPLTISTWENLKSTGDSNGSAIAQVELLQFSSDDGHPIETKLDFCLHKIGTRWMLAMAWPPNAHNLKACTAARDWPCWWRTDSPQATVETLLSHHKRDQVRDGLDKELWRRLPSGAERLEEYQYGPVAPQSWSKTEDHQMTQAALLTYEVISACDRTDPNSCPAGENRKNAEWNFCLNETVEGWRIVGIWGFGNRNIQACAQTPSKYQIGPQQRPAAVETPSSLPIKSQRLPIEPPSHEAQSAKPKMSFEDALKKMLDDENRALEQQVPSKPKVSPQKSRAASARGKMSDEEILEKLKDLP